MIERESFWIRSIGKSATNGIIKIAIKKIPENVCAKIIFYVSVSERDGKGKTVQAVKNSQCAFHVCMIETKNLYKIILELEKLCLVACRGRRANQN